MGVLDDWVAIGTPDEDEWRVELDAPFAAELSGDDAALNVDRLTIGSHGIDGNFLLRGDVKVFYNLPAIDDSGVGRIVVEMQRFGPVGGSANTAEQLSPLRLWAYRGDLAPPSEKGEGDVCADMFSAGCSIQAYYADVAQPVGFGANLRVYLPADFRGHLQVVTQDDVWPDCSYLSRSDVTIDDLYGSADVELGSGVARVELAANILPAPYCDPDADINAAKNAACDDYIDPGSLTPRPWDPECGCLAWLGKAQVQAHRCRAADIIVDAPPDFWSVITTATTAPGEAANEANPCTATVDCEGFSMCGVDSSRCNDHDPWHCAARTNAPAGSIPGTGYELKVTSPNCQEVEFHDAASGYGEPPALTRRGFIEVCSGCLDIPEQPPPP